jgi:hypothetical protein
VCIRVLYADCQWPEQRGKFPYCRVSWDVGVSDRGKALLIHMHAFSIPRRRQRGLSFESISPWTGQLSRLTLLTHSRLDLTSSAVPTQRISIMIRTLHANISMDLVPGSATTKSAVIPAPARGGAWLSVPGNQAYVVRYCLGEPFAHSKVFHEYAIFQEKRHCLDH